MNTKRMRRPLLIALFAWTALACSDEETTPPPGSDTASVSDTSAAETETSEDSTPSTDTTPAPTADQAAIAGVEETEAWTLPGLSAPVHVLRTEANVPHIYAQNRNDLARTLGFVVARDRFFVMDLQRRLGLGTLTELLGDNALANDQEARGVGMTYVAERLLDAASPELLAYMDAFAEGINVYIERVSDGSLPGPSELEFAKAFLGAENAADLMQPFNRRSIAGMMAVIMYETNYESGDVGRAAAASKLDTLFEGVAHAALRKDGYLNDIWDNVTPLFDYSSAAGLNIETASEAGAAKPGPAFPVSWRTQATLPAEMLTRLQERLQRFQLKLGRDQVAGFGSNAWAVAGSASTDGSSLTAGDGHLPLSIPALMYQVGLNTTVFGGGNTHQSGLLLTGLPLMAVGTNGKVAWSQVNPVVDITDWYQEELQLDENGIPVSSTFQGEDKPLTAVEETYEIADVPALSSVGRTEKWTRWSTFDGRWIAEIEGRSASPEEELAPGETLVNLQGKWVVPGDMNEDGVISAISFDYAAFDVTQYLHTLDQFGYAQNVAELQDVTRGLVGGGLFTAAGDADGDILFSSYQAIPCRGYLERDEEGAWADGANPTQLLNGKIYGGFHLPTLDSGWIDEEAAEDDPYACAVPFEAMPQAVSPDPGFVATANNDPGNLTTDGSLTDDAWYLGGPWSPTRADTIARELEKAIAADNADIAQMATIQGNKDSRLGETFVPFLLAAISEARGLAQLSTDKEAHQQRLVDLYNANSTRFDEVFDRLTAWKEAGYHAASGVSTFYETPSDTDQSNAVATMIYNAWQARFLQQVWSDEPLGGAWQFSSSRIQVTQLHRFLVGRGPTNTQALTSWYDETGEAIFFDRLGTEEVERSNELMLQALTDALLFLEQAPDGPGQGGFGTDDMSQWLWGLRHQARFESLLAEFLGDDPAFGFLAELFSVTTQSLPLADEYEDGDPRADLTWFPRGGDQWAVDAANPGFSGTNFTHANGPVMRMVIALKDGEVSGQNIVPGGQSGVKESPNFSDQLEHWLANTAIPLRFHPSDVVAGATGREVYSPAE